MALVNFFDHDGNQFEANVEPGTSLMHAAVDNGIDGIVGECGGSCACATCHCYIDETWLSKAEPASQTERDMLDCVNDPQENSRLACQVKVTEELDGITVHMPESQF